MQFINISALACALLSVSGLASPAPQAPWRTEATVQLANDQTGVYSNVAVPIDGVKRPVQELWGNTAIETNGLVFASSSQLTAFDQTTVCTITEESGLIATLTAEKTWVSVGGQVEDLCSAFIECECDFMSNF